MSMPKAQALPGRLELRAGEEEELEEEARAQRDKCVISPAGVGDHRRMLRKGCISEALHTAPLRG